MKCINPEYPDNPGGSSIGKGSTQRRRPPPPSGAKSRTNPWFKLLWYLIISIVLLVVSMILPLIFSPSMQLNFNARVESIGEWDGDTSHILDGATEEIYVSSITAEYISNFSANNLDVEKSTFRVIEFLYGPVLVTGSPLLLVGTPTDENPEFASNAEIKFSTFWMQGIFYVIFIVVLILMGVILKKQPEILKFIIILTVVWALWALIAYASKGMALGKVSTLLNQLLTEEQGSANYSLTLLSVMFAPVKVFIVGVVIMVLASLFRKAKSEQGRGEIPTLKMRKP